jgi:hypothetical protein
MTEQLVPERPFIGGGAALDTKYGGVIRRHD